MEFCLCMIKDIEDCLPFFCPFFFLLRHVIHMRANKNEVNFALVYAGNCSDMQV